MSKLTGHFKAVSMGDPLPQSKTLLIVGVISDAVPGGHIANGAVPGLTPDAHGVALVGQMGGC